MIHEFKKKFKEGEIHAHTLDVFFSKQFEIIEANRKQESLGIDRIFISKLYGFRYSVEYKADSRAAETGNVFIEVTSVDTMNEPGWALSSTAQILIYYIPPEGKVFIVRMLNIRDKIKKWSLDHGIKLAHNITYNTKGIPVPIDVFKTIVQKIEFIPFENRTF